MKDINIAVRDLLRTIPESRANYWASYATDFTCPFLFAYLGLSRPFSWPSALLMFTVGVAAFSLAEYSIHRWLLHHPKSPLFSLHEAHHREPEKTAAFFFPTSILVLMGVWLILTRLVHLPEVSFFICGFAFGYCCFGTLHHIEHSTRINHLPFRWLQHRWAAHSVHHRRDRMNFGVTTSLWDRIFQTHHTRKASRQA